MGAYDPKIPIPTVELGDEFKRPENLPGFTTKVKTQCGNFYLTSSYALFEGRVRLVELFAGCGSLEREGALCGGGLLMTCKLVSKTLQRGIPNEDVAMDVKGNPCAMTPDYDTVQSSCPIAIWVALRDFPQDKIEAVLFGQEVKQEACEAAPAWVPQTPGDAVALDVERQYIEGSSQTDGVCQHCADGAQGCDVCNPTGDPDGPPEKRKKRK
jgi:hypothetical protein